MFLSQNFKKGYHFVPIKGCNFETAAPLFDISLNFVDIGTYVKIWSAK
jgi:hypothetical protein